MKTIANNIAALQARIPANVTLVGVTKTRPINDARAVLAAGVSDLGENRVQEATEKFPQLYAEQPFRRHLIGHLQTNKATAAVRLFDLIHSVDSTRLTNEINRHSLALGKVQDILLEVNISGEESKHGLHPDEVSAVLMHIAQECPAVRVCGLMTMAPFELAPQDTRPVFAGLRKLSENLRRNPAHQLGIELSMGMTNDFEIAIEEGATIIRIGTALFESSS